ncbi:MAG: type II toxin-antitoxin system VapC family toxin, partial [Sulfuricaulis sp.]
MIYVDTSALVPIFIREPKSEAVIDWIESSGERLAISEWALVEFASAVAIKVRTDQVAANLAKQATARVHEFAQKHCAVAVPGQEEFRRAAELAGD